MNSKPSRTSLILPEKELRTKIAALRKVFAAKPGTRAADVRDRLETLLKHYLAERKSINEISILMNKNLGTTFTPTAWKHYCQRWGLPIYRKPKSWSDPRSARLSGLLSPVGFEDEGYSAY